jgi:hypothetical protein
MKSWDSAVLPARVHTRDLALCPATTPARSHREDTKFRTLRSSLGNPQRATKLSSPFYQNRALGDGGAMQVQSSVKGTKR